MNFLSNTATALLLASATFASAEAKTQLTIPIIVPITGLLALEGTSQLNGASMAIAHAPADLTITSEVVDSGTAAEGGANALERVGSGKNVEFVVAPLFGTQVLAMLPVALEYKMPIIAPTGTGPVTEQGNPYVFRLYPSDEVSKVAHVRYTNEIYHPKRAAILYNNTGYGQSGFQWIKTYFDRSNVEVVYSEGVELTTKDVSATLAKLKALKPDVIMVQMHSASIAMVIKQAATLGVGIPIVGNTTIAMPATVALLEPSDLRGVCAESASWLEEGSSPGTDRFLKDYTAKYGAPPDAYAIQQYDGLLMSLTAVEAGAKTPADIRKYLSTQEYRGVGMTYKADAKGNLAHSAVIVCYDGTSRTPTLVKRYNDIDGF